MLAQHANDNERTKSDGRRVKVAATEAQLLAN